MAKDDLNKYLTNIYYDAIHPASYGGVEKLYRFTKSEGKNISKGRVKKWLSEQNIYNKHKPIRYNFKRTRVVVPTKLYQFDADTVSMVRYVKDNNGYRYILILIDVLSRYAWTFPLKSLTGKEMVRALTQTLVKLPQKLRTDSGSECANSPVKSYLKSKGVDIFHTHNEKKANYAERLIQTLKTKITKYLQHTKSFKWVDILPKITESYNKTYHRSIQMSPAAAMRTDDVKLWIGQYNPVSKRVKKEPNKPSRVREGYKFKLGDTVKLAFNRSTVERAYDEKWTDEYFIVTGRVIKQGICMYTIKDFDNDPVKGSFYESEMQKILIKEVNKVYNIEKIIKKRKRNGKREVLVKWEGWHRKFNSWIPESEVEDI